MKITAITLKSRRQLLLQLASGRECIVTIRRDSNSKDNYISYKISYKIRQTQDFLHYEVETGNCQYKPIDLNLNEIVEWYSCYKPKVFELQSGDSLPTELVDMLNDGVRFTIKYTEILPSSDSDT